MGNYWYYHKMFDNKYKVSFKKRLKIFGTAAF